MNDIYERTQELVSRIVVNVYRFGSGYSREAALRQKLTDSAPSIYDFIYIKSAFLMVIDRKLYLVMHMTGIDPYMFYMESDIVIAQLFYKERKTNIMKITAEGEILRMYTFKKLRWVNDEVDYTRLTALLELGIAFKYAEVDVK
jgi:hypothetical protein